LGSKFIRQSHRNSASRSFPHSLRAVSFFARAPKPLLSIVREMYRCNLSSVFIADPISGHTPGKQTTTSQRYRPLPPRSLPMANFDNQVAMEVDQPDEQAPPAEQEKFAGPLTDRLPRPFPPLSSEGLVEGSPESWSKLGDSGPFVFFPAPANLKLRFFMFLYSLFRIHLPPPPCPRGVGRGPSVPPRVRASDGGGGEESGHLRKIPTSGSDAIQTIETPCASAAE